MNEQQQQQPAPATITEESQLEGLLDRVLAKTERIRGDITLSPRGLDFGNFEGLCRWAKYIVASGFGPKGMTHEQAIVCIVMGRNVGLDPFQAVQNIAVINGRPSLYGDAPLAICRQHPLWQESGFSEYWEVDGKRVDAEPDPAAFAKDGTAAIVESLRKGSTKPKVTRFSIAHAKAAGLLGKAGNLYGGYAQRMLRFRARGYNLRDNFGDALKGIGIQELTDLDQEAAEQKKGPPEGRTRTKQRQSETMPTGNGETPRGPTPSVGQATATAGGSDDDYSPELHQASPEATVLDSETHTEAEGQPDLPQDDEEDRMRDDFVTDQKERITAAADAKDWKAFDVSGSQISEKASWIGQFRATALLDYWRAEKKRVWGDVAARAAKKKEPATT